MAEATKPPSRSAFIRSCPLDMTVDDLLRRAQAEGVPSITRRYVYVVRTEMRAAAPGASPKAAPRRGSRPTRETLVRAEEELKRFAARIGLERTMALLSELQRRVVDFVAKKRR